MAISDEDRHTFREDEAERIDLEPALPRPWVVFRDENILACYVCKTFQLLPVGEPLEISTMQNALIEFSEAHRKCLTSVARKGRDTNRYKLTIHDAEVSDALYAAAVLYLEYSNRRMSKTEAHIFEHPKLGKFEITFRREGYKRADRAKFMGRDTPEVADLKKRVKTLFNMAKTMMKSAPCYISDQKLTRFRQVLSEERKLARQSK